MPPTDPGAAARRRWFLAAVAATYLAIFCAAASWGWTPAWSAVGVRPLPMPFADLRAFTGINIALERGLDPLVDNSGDPWRRPLNAPRIWVRLVKALRITPDDTIRIGVVLFLAFLVALWLLARLVDSASDAVLLYVAAVLPATLLSVERGKVDAIVFLLVCAAIVAAPRTWLRAALLTAAAALKLFPIFGVAAMAMRGRRALAAGVGALLFFAGMAYVIRDDLRIISAGLPIDSIGAYGVPSVALGLSQVTSGRISFASATWLSRAIASALLVSGAIAGIRLVERGIARPFFASTALRGEAFAIAAAIYGGTYLVAANYDYRLVFMLPAVPLLNSARASSTRMAWFGFAGLVSLALAMSETPLTLALHRAGTMINVAAKVALLGIAACGITAWFGGVCYPAFADRHIAVRPRR